MRQKAKYTKEAIAKTSFMHFETSGIIGRPFTLLKKPIIKKRMVETYTTVGTITGYQIVSTEACMQILPTSN